MKTRTELQAENDCLRAALADILDACAREKTDQADWPRTVGAVQYIARTALSGPAVELRGDDVPAWGG